MKKIVIVSLAWVLVVLMCNHKQSLAPNRQCTLGEGERSLLSVWIRSSLVALPEKHLLGPPGDVMGILVVVDGLAHQRVPANT